MPNASCEARYEADELESVHVAPVPLAPTSPAYAYACSDAPDASSECTMSARMSMLDLCADVDAKACIYARSLSPAAVEALELSPVSLVDMLSRTHTRHASREPELEIEVKHPENQVSVPTQTQIQIQTPNRIQSQNQNQNQPDARVSGKKDAQRHDRQCDLSTSIQVQACMPTLASMLRETTAIVDKSAHLNSGSTSIANSTHSSTHIHPATAVALCLATDLNAAPAPALALTPTPAPVPAAVAATPKRTPFHDVEAVRAAARIVSGTDHAFEGEIYAIPSTPSERERDVERSMAQADVRPRGQCVRGVARWKIDRYQLKAGERSGPFRERLVVQISLNATTTVIMGIDARNFIDREAETSVRRVQVDEPTELCLGTVNVSASLVAHEFVSYVRHLDSAICMRATTSRSWLIYYMPPLLFEHFVQAAHALHHTSVKLGALRLRMRATTEAEDRETRRRSIACCDEYRTNFAWPAAHVAPPRPAPHPHPHPHAHAHSRALLKPPPRAHQAL